MRHSALFGVVSPSPFEPLQAHMAVVTTCARELPGFFSACMDQNWAKAKDIEQRVFELEHRADLLKRQIMLRLRRGILMPIPKDALVRLLQAQDLIANKVDDIVGRTISREVAIPKEIASDFFAYVDHCVAVATLTERVIGELDDLIETGFGNAQVGKVHHLVEAIDHHEDRSRILLRAARRQIYQHEKNLSDLDATFLYRTVDRLSELAAAMPALGMELDAILLR